MKSLIVFIAIIIQASCTGLPQGISPINQFNIQQYLGDWYEIARLDHSFEKNLTHVTAHYSLHENGNITVINRGYDSINKQWKEAEGKAQFVGGTSIAHLKVSFFGPFYGSYVVFKIDNKDYQYAYISSYNRDFLWLLSREPTVSDRIKKDFLKTANKFGFNTRKLIFVDHSSPIKH